MPPSAAGKARDLPGLASKPLASANWRAGAGNSLRIASHVALVTKVIGVTAVVGAVSNTDGMRLSAVLASLVGYYTPFMADGSAPAVDVTCGIGTGRADP